MWAITHKGSGAQDTIGTTSWPSSLKKSQTVALEEFACAVAFGWRTNIPTEGPFRTVAAVLIVDPTFAVVGPFIAFLSLRTLFCVRFILVFPSIWILFCVFVVLSILDIFLILFLHFWGQGLLRGISIKFGRKWYGEYIWKRCKQFSGICEFCARRFWGKLRAPFLPELLRQIVPKILRRGFYRGLRRPSCLRLVLFSILR